MVCWVACVDFDFGFMLSFCFVCSFLVGCLFIWFYGYLLIFGGRYVNKVWGLV